MSKFTHIDDKGQVRMVDVTDKKSGHRVAVAKGEISMKASTMKKVLDHTVKKGNVLETARIAGIMGAKKTSELIPMCHPLNLTHVSIDFFPDLDNNCIRVEATARLIGKTGVEMEALTAVTTAVLTIYDMCKSHDNQMSISNIYLLRKSGGKSGTFVRE